MSRKAIGWGGVLMLLVLLAAGYTSTSLDPGFMDPPPSPARRASAIAALRQQVESAFGPRLGSVDIAYGRYWLTPTYFGSFRLKGIPLTFYFQPTEREMLAHQDRLPATALVDNGAIGGNDRFVRLARQFHLDFPAQRTMYYWFIRYPDQAPQDLVGLVPDTKAVSVVVYDRNDFWGGESHSLGIYAWDAKRNRWSLAHRGEIPEFR